MTRPGTQVTLRNTPSVISLPTDTGTAFIAGLSDRGSLTATRIGSINEFTTVYGARQSYSPLYDAVELFFREGGNSCYIGRVVGPAATSGSRNLLDGSSAISLTVTAVGPGAWSANYKVGVVAGSVGGTYRINVTDLSNVVLEDSGDLATQQAAAYWSLFSSYVRITVGVSANNPVVAAPAVLSTGNDDRVNITDTQWLNALNSFTADLGPGQVLAPGRVTTAGQQQLINHAEANGRVALIDLTDTSTVATLVSATAALTKSRFAACFSPWIVMPGVSGATSTRTVPPSGMIAGIIARNDPSLGPNRPSAGAAGVSRYAVNLSQGAYSDTNRTTLNQAGVDLVRNIYGSIRVYGWRSLADPVADSDWIDFGNGRLFVALVAELNAVGENYVFDVIDGLNGETIGNFHAALAGVLLSHYSRGELFGDSADEAFSVDTSSAVNTPTTIANQELHAVCAVRMSPMAELVAIEIVKVAVTQSV